MKLEGSPSKQTKVPRTYQQRDFQCLNELSSPAPESELVDLNPEKDLCSGKKGSSSKGIASAQAEVLKNLVKSRRGELLLVEDSRNADIVTLVSAATLRCSKFFSGLGRGYVGALAQRLRDKLGRDAIKMPEEEIVDLAVAEATLMSQSVQGRHRKIEGGISRLEEKTVRMSEIRYR